MTQVAKMKKAYKNTCKPAKPQTDIGLSKCKHNEWTKKTFKQSINYEK